MFDSFIAGDAFLMRNKKGQDTSTERDSNEYVRRVITINGN